MQNPGTRPPIEKAAENRRNAKEGDAEASLRYQDEVRKADAPNSPWTHKRPWTN